MISVSNTSWSSAEVAQLAAQDLADVGLGQRVDEAHARGTL
jgi:hypothetical protein